MKSFLTILITVTSLNLGMTQIVIDKVVAKVGGETILLSDIESQYEYTKQQNPGIDESMKCQILESIIQQKVIINQAKLDSVIVLPEEVEQRLDLKLDNVLRQMNGDEAFFIEYYGASPDEMKDKLREDERQALLAERMQTNLIGSINVTPSEVVEFYNSIPADSLPYLSSEVEISELVYEPKVNAEERLDALNLANDLYAKLQNGEDFEVLAKKYSDDPGSKSNGGNLGFAKRGTYVTEFEATAFSLEKMEISEPVETEFGFHIIQMLERRGNNIKLRHILLTPNITAADLEKAQADLDSIKTLIETDVMTFDQAVYLHSAESSQGKNYAGRLRNPSSGTTFFETRELPTDIYFEIDNLEVGQITEPAEITSPRGETVYRILKLDSRTQPHKANLEEDYSKIQLFAKENKKQAFFFEWINEKKQNTLIEVNPIYDFCPSVESYISN
jgi:peptidyl-prolyl cis-trans isomerase SurA